MEKAIYHLITDFPSTPVQVEKSDNSFILRNSIMPLMDGLWSFEEITVYDLSFAKSVEDIEMNFDFYWNRAIELQIPEAPNPEKQMDDLSCELYEQLIYTQAAQEDMESAMCDLYSSMLEV